jgi:hypothetical protein
VTGNRQISSLTAAVLFITLFVSASAANSQSRSQLSGIVTDGLVPDYMARQQISGAIIRLYSLNQVLQTKSDKAGNFQFTNLPDDVYDLEIAASGFKTKSIESIRITRPSDLYYDVALKIDTLGCTPEDSISYESTGYRIGPVVTGKVIDYDTHRPISRVEVRLFHTTDKPVSGSLTDDRGEFRFSPRDIMSPGRYFLKTTRRGYRTTISQQFWVTQAGQTVVSVRQLKNGMMIVCE